jgi:colanic acid/amylovoran biosynthesis glycosyltransferase
MRVAYFINQYPAVSVAFIRREIHALEKLGIEVIRYALKGWDANTVDPLDTREKEITTYLQRDGARALIASVLRMMVSSPRLTLRGLAAAFSLGIASQRPLLVHIAYFVEACRLRLLLERAGVKHVHAHFATNSTEIVLLSRIMGGPTYSFTVHGPEEFDDPVGLKLREKIRLAKFVVAITSFTRGQLMRVADRGDWEKIALIRCGLHSDIFEQSATPVTSDVRMVVVGRLVEQKGHLLLLEAARELKRRGLEFKLLVIGDGPLRGVLEETAERYSLGGQVEFTGSVPTSRLYDEIKRARALVLPSFAEGLPMAIMEAMALRRPVISTFIAGIPELVVPGENGWLVPAGSVDLLVDAIQEVLESSPEQLNAMGERAFAKTCELHSADKTVTQLVRLIASGD